MSSQFPMAILAGLVLTSCAVHTWQPGPNQTAANFGEASGQCEMAALSGDSNGFVGAYGSPKFVGAFVGGGLVLGAISARVRAQNIYNACMQASGFVPMDGAP